MAVYYNEFKPEAAHMLRQLIRDGIIADGEVDERSIVDVKADDLKGFTQCHFFAGIGGWSVALRLSGWPDDRPVWTGSCPCQPFSSAGKQKGHGDERHLWPYWSGLIRESKPSVIFGEQVASAITYGWWDEVATDLETQKYACASAVLPACSVGKPHRRDRLWFVADANGQRSTRGNRCHAISSESNIGKQSLQKIRTPDANKTDGLFCSSRPMGDSEHNGWNSTEVRRSDAGNAIDRAKEGANSTEQSQGTSATCDVAHPGLNESGGWDTLRDTGSEDARAASENEGSGAPRGGEARQRPIDDLADGSAGRSSHVGNPECRGRQGQGTLGESSGAAQGGFRQTSESLDDCAELQWISCPDGKSRPVEPGIRLLAHGIQHRAPVLHAFGNAIVPQVAAAFIRAYREIVE